MKFSIVIPSYNQQDYLPEAISSALLQDAEVIVVDDGSTDNSLEIARMYPVKVISQVNKGLASARNTGIMNATGEYVLFLDADDILLEDCVKELSKYNTDIISPSFVTFGKVSQEVILMPNPTLEDFKTGNRLGCCSAVKRSVLLEVGGYSPRMTWGYEDLHLWINLLRRGYTLTTIQKVLWMYRVKEHSMITDAQSHHEELMKQINKDFKLW
jgi:glycosyltransferase involved in cell wall biosynthesis